MLNNNVITVLNSVSSITNSAVLKYPISVINSEAGDIYVRVDINVLDEDSFDDIGIYDLNNFLSVFGLYGENRDVEVSADTITVSDSTGSLSSLLIDEINILGDYNKDPIMFEKTKSVDTVATFELSKEVMKKLKSATGVYKTLSDLNIISQDTNVVLQLAQNNSFNARSSSHQYTVDGITSKEFKITIPVENFSKLPISSYTVQVKYNANANAYRLLLICNDIPGIEIIMSVKI